MRRLLLGAALIMAVAMHAGAAAAQTTGPQNGRFCSSPGATAVDSQGRALVCDNQDANGRFHWTLAGATTASTYQPGSCTGTTNLGSVGVGQTVSGTIAPGCVYSGQVTMGVNGTSGGTKTPNPGGGVTVNLQATSQTSGLLNDPVTVPLQCGTNTITATGTTAQGPASASGTFTLTCAAASAPAGTTATPSSVAFTGANMLRWSLWGGTLVGLGLMAMAIARWRQAS